MHDAGEPEDVATVREQQRERILIPRQDVANTIQARRRKGTLALLEELARDVAAWPSRAVEFYKLLGGTQNIHPANLGRPKYYVVRVGETMPVIAQQHRMTLKELLWLNPGIKSNASPIAGTRLLIGWRVSRGQTADLRAGDPLDLVDGPFDSLAHTVDVRRISSQRAPGRYNIPDVGVFVWRLKPYSVTLTPAFCVDERPNCYTFSVLGNDAPLYHQPRPESSPTHIADELNLPVPIRRRALQRHTTDYQGEGKSLQIWIGTADNREVISQKIVSADLARWQYQTKAGDVAVDPVRGRIAFSESETPRDQVVWVDYHYAFSADIGGGEYDRPLSQPQQYQRYPVGEKEANKTINAALTQWQQDLANTPSAQLQNAVIEITDSGLYEESIRLKLGKNQTVQIRAANRKRPVVSLPETRAKFDALFISGDQASRVILDGLLIVGRGVKISGPARAASSKDVKTSAPVGDLCDVTIRHCTLVPGWSLGCGCEPCKGEEPSLVLAGTCAAIKIEHSILGTIEVEANEAATDPVRLCLSDSILDATSGELPALNGVESEIAYVRATIARCTVLGKFLAHEIALAENCIFNGHVCVARRQKGCVRFCHVPADSRTPRRYECQPDLVVKAVQDRAANKSRSPRRKPRRKSPANNCA